MLDSAPVTALDLCPVLSAYRKAVEVSLKVVVLGGGCAARRWPQSPAWTSSLSRTIKWAWVVREQMYGHAGPPLHRASDVVEGSLCVPSGGGVEFAASMEDRPHHWTVGVAIAAILVAGVSALFTYLQWTEAKQARIDAKEASKSQAGDVRKSSEAADRSAKAAERSASVAEESLLESKHSLVTAERAWLNVATATIHLPTDGHGSPTVDTTITNYGKTPAYNVRIRQVVALTARLDLTVDSDSATTTNPYIVPPGSSVVMKNNPRFPITTEVFKQLMAKQLYLQYYGRAEYLDVFKQKHQTTWCAYSSPDTGDIYACPANNYSN